MQMVTNATGAVQLTLTDHEAQKLEEFLHVAAMSQMTWPLCVGQFMTERKRWHELRRKQDGASASSDSSSPGGIRGD